MTGAGTTLEVVSSYVQLLRQPLARPLVAASVLGEDLPARDWARPCAVIVAPHPDDECLTGILPLRLKRDAGWQVVVIAATLGSNEMRRAERAAEQTQACAVLGFDAMLPLAGGFTDVNEQTRADNPELWLVMMGRLAAIIAALAPQAVFIPHEKDMNATHIGVHHLTMDALRVMPPEFSCSVVQTEYWQPMETPNMLVEVSETDVALLMSALACHAGEVARNPYDRRFPAHLIDNVRRGSERLNGKGTASAPMDFGTLYQRGLWRNGKYMPSALNRFIAAGDDVAELFD